MRIVKETQNFNPLEELCVSVRNFVSNKDYKSCEKIIYKAMEIFPHAPEPHNLLGIVLEKTGNHMLAMKHFRASIALDPSYRPASQNLETYGTFYTNKGCAFDESDVC